MREQIVFQLDEEVKKKLEDWAHSHGWELDEAIRYILGEKVLYLETISPLRAVGPPFSSLTNISKETDNTAKTMAQMMASTGMCQCKNCLRKLTAEEIIAGECSECGEKL